MCMTPHITDPVVSTIHTSLPLQFVYPIFTITTHLEPFPIPSRNKIRTLKRFQILINYFILNSFRIYMFIYRVYGGLPTY